MQRTFDSLTEWSTTGNLSAEETLTRQIDLLQNFAGGPRGYRLRRILLTNFWLYGQQEFEILHGRLFLAGENASGKSTVLSAAIPLALDGDIRPNRLDTFGGRERHMEYYVLGGTESATPYSHERRTAYIALEFEWCDPDAPPIAQELRQRWENGEREQTRFLTIGLSLAGNINASDRIKPLRFLITDGSRLGYDIFTTHPTGNKQERRAYDHSRFKQVLEGHGIVCESRDDYEQKVARYLFGFTDVKEFQKLITLLLVLRRPNLSTELSFSKVHDFLKISLRKISSETTNRVIGTIERIDAIQSEIERIQEAYNATEHLHAAQQNVALVDAQLAACEYIGAQQAEQSVQLKVNKLRKDLATAENERDKTAAHAQALQQEQFQVSGQIKALEASEGLQVAQQLASARERVQDTQAQLHLQEKNLEGAQHAIQASQQYLQRQQARFNESRTESIAQLHELSSVAAEDCHWEVAAFQLEAAGHQIESIQLDAATRPELPQNISSLLEVRSEERISWLHQLEELHKRREQLESKIQHARELEAMRFQDLDDTGRRFSSLKEQAYEAEQKLVGMLEELRATDDTNALLFLDETIQLSANSGDDEALIAHEIEQFTANLQGYRQAIDTLDRDLTRQVEQLQSTLAKLQQQMGGKLREVAEAKALYEQKCAEPEYTPQHSAQRTLARAKLAEQGIAALPLYALLDFAPHIDSASEEAGRIEYMLADAGLLDALVVAPHQLAVADALLKAAGLSDCRLNIEALSHAARDRQVGETLENWLRFDTAVANDGIDWETTTATILRAIGQFPHIPCTFNEDGTWQHGLLQGYASGGTVQFIGKANRLRVKQQEQEELHRQWMQRDKELQELRGHIAESEQQRTQLQETQLQLRKVLTISGIEEAYSQLISAGAALDNAKSKYQRARQQTQETIQNRNAVLAQLERESNGVSALAGHAGQVHTALLGMHQLKNEARAVRMQLAAIANNWEEYRQAGLALEKARDNVAQVTSLYDYARNQAVQAQAEEKELRHIAEKAQVEDLSKRLHELRERNELLYTQINEEKERHARADERSKSIGMLLLEAEIQLTKVRTERITRQGHFNTLLGAYPVEQLAYAQEISQSGKSLNAAQELLGGPVPEAEIAVQRDLLENKRRVSYNALLQIYNQEQHLLHEYGPSLDEQERVIFLYENKSTPAALLEILSDRIEMQKALLGQKERQLFEDFLLQEIAEAIRTHILEAEEWIQQINGVLKSLPLIGEHYDLTWKPPLEYDTTKPGSHLARQYKLLRKPSQSLTDEETETLMGAFRQEIDIVRQKQEEDPGLNFMEVLEQVFDYREWFHFDVWITPIGGQRQRLTDRLAGTRSGAEQLFALYVPLFAALAAVYKTAAPGAPRLLALDEAFDKVSVANTQRIMEFLVSQDFQWMMTGPQISGTSEKIPASARYLMIHEKGSPIATASASFWAGNQGLQTK